MMSEEDYVIFSETRMTDDKNLVSYTEYASGLFDIVYSWGRNPNVSISTYKVM